MPLKQVTVPQVVTLHKAMTLKEVTVLQVVMVPQVVMLHKAMALKQVTVPQVVTHQ
jgi:hypothetical protein